MEVLYVLIPVAIILTLVASALYIWAVSSGQYDDLDREAETILFDESEVPAAGEQKTAAEDNRGQLD